MEYKHSVKKDFLAPHFGVGYFAIIMHNISKMIVFDWPKCQDLKGVSIEYCLKFMFIGWEENLNPHRIFTMLNFLI
jgi:hypothetical protein